MELAFETDGMIRVAIITGLSYKRREVFKTWAGPIILLELTATDGRQQTDRMHMVVYIYGRG